MKKVFFVDDEILVREGIRNTINWRGEGFIYCGDAPDGESALPLIEELVPDIVITDIKMPFMDGLELSKIMKQRMPSIKIIILSGHDEFDYAREALRIGVTEYCVKPVDSKDLIQLLHQVGNQIDIESQKRDELEYLKRKMDESVTFTKEKLLSDLCFGLVSAAAVIQASAAVNLKLLSRYYMVVITDYESSESANSLYTSEILHFKRNKREAVWIFRGEHPQELTEMAEQFIESVKWVADEEGPDTLIVGIGSIQDRMLGISQSYREAEEDKNFQYISKKYYNTSFRNNEVEMEHIIFLD
ncbi:MAG TPA: response regulator, partial [Bacilli bacterium]